jgi:hypothetical protein
MGNYQDSQEQKRPMSAAYTSESIADFGSDFLKASEIERLELDKMKEIALKVNVPLTFLLINTALNQVLSDMEKNGVGMIAPTKEYKTKEK